MSSNRPNLTVDQQFFQELLSAAFTIQEHNDRLNQPSSSPVETIAPEPEPKSLCPRCGALKANAQAQCQKCAPDEFRPGERMQRKWASMWLLSQQQGLWPERTADAGETAGDRPAPLEMKRGPQSTAGHDFAGSGIVSLPFEGSLQDEGVVFNKTQVDHRINGDRPNGNGRNGDHLKSDGLNGNRANGNGKNGAHGGTGNGNGSSLFTQPVPDEFEFKTEFPVSNWTFETTESQPSTVVPELHLPGERLSGTDFGGDIHAYEHVTNDVTTEDFDLTAPTSQASADEALALDDASATAGDYGDEAESALVEPDAPHISTFHRVAEWRVKLRFHRADVYLGAAVLVAATALLWPVPGSSQHPSLSLWDRTLIAMGIAEAPAPTIHVQGDPAIEVWVDPHTALYYCPGEEQYGKTPDGRFNSQREAQMDRFEPAGRLACE